MTKGLHVPSEIGKLRKVCLHRPGDELLNLPPDELERLLFDDVPFLEVAQQEHDTFAQILRDQGVEVLYLENLVAEVFDQVPGARAEFTDQYIAEAGIRGQHMPQIVREKLDSIEDNLEFVKKTMAGMTKSEIDMPLTASTTLDSLVNSESESDLIIDPMPNLYFTRDPFAVVGEGVNLNRMYSVTRNRETLYGKYVFKYHPDYKDVSLYFRRDCQFHTEGGDVLNINEKTLAVGISQRTQAAAIDVMAQNIFWNSDSKVERILAFDIPVSRAFMHLDTVFTQIDVDKFTIHPAIMGPLTVFEITPDGNRRGAKIRRSSDKLGAHPRRVHRRRPGQADPLRRRRPDRGLPRAVERRLQHPVRRARQDLRLRPQHRHQRRAVQGGPGPSRRALRRALPRPRRPALHEHALLARGPLRSFRTRTGHNTYI